jgi:protein-S-isoprenylcysteine O-methyltransferase Ste14
MRLDAVVSDGPYRRERHPFYVGWFLALFGLAIVGRSILALALVAILLATLIALARFEERLLAAELGVAYEKYRDETPAIAGFQRQRL